jgi:wyosine [tRNA(Phe)-imidazoG37] synthetase (radical SAM superfamily)
LERREFFPLWEVLEELGDYLSRSPPLDFITFSGSGEPTLSSSIGNVIRFIKNTFPAYRVAILTNGSLLWRPDVREDLLLADIVLPTLCSVFDSTFRKIHRPAPGISTGQIVAGLELFRREFSGEIWLEIFIIPGINTDIRELEGLREAIEQICPDRVQLNTLDRPSSEDWVIPADSRELEQIRIILGLTGIEAVEPVQYELSARSTMTEDWEAAIAAVRELLMRRPCTLEDLSVSTGLSRREILKILREIQVTTPVDENREERGIFYFCPR